MVPTIVNGVGEEWAGGTHKFKIQSNTGHSHLAIQAIEVNRERVGGK